MGVERAVTRWYVQQQVLLTEIAMLSAKIAPAPVSNSAYEEVHVDIVPPGTVNADEVAQQLARVQEKLHLLGPCPKPMMG